MQRSADGWNIQILSSLLYPVMHCFQICERYTYLPLVFALLSNKDQLTYEFVFRRSIDQCNSVNLMLSPRTVITDFEKAAMNAVSTIFQNAQRRGCRFHFGQPWWRRIQSLGMSEDYKDKNSAISK